jgi:hypothetical protein
MQNNKEEWEIYVGKRYIGADVDTSFLVLLYYPNIFSSVFQDPFMQSYGVATAGYIKGKKKVFFFII